MGKMSVKLNDDEIYSKAPLTSLDKSRHIGVEEAYDLVGSQKDRNLPLSSLKRAVDEGKIHIYHFNGISYLDRLDIGRIYHKSRKKIEGLSIDRYFSIEGENPFEAAGPYQNVSLSISGEGIDIFRMDDACFPTSWDNQNCNKIVAQKYFFKPYKEVWKQALRAKIGKDHEFSPVHLIGRVTNFIISEGDKLGYFRTQRDKEIFADELRSLQINRRFAFNSPVQFNAGIFHEYGVSGSEGVHYFRDPKTGIVSKVEEGEYIHPQSHACFIKGPQDNLESILAHVIDEGAVFSSGSGIGQDIGVLRGEGEPLSGGGKASGAISFLGIYDDAAGTIKSGGKSRRAARMTIMNYQHPDIMAFIRSKVKEDHKALVLMRAGYGGGMDGEAVRTVTMQNTNISVRVDDEFFEKVRNGGKVKLKRVIDGIVVDEIDAKRMLQEIAYGSWRVGDPAVQYDSKIHEMHTCKNSGRQRASNPCSEYLWLDNTSCNLGSHNLLSYSDSEGNFNFESFTQAVRLTQIAQDILNDASSYPVRDIANISPEFRTTGIGYCNLGALLMRKGLAYDSEEGRTFTSAVTALLTGIAYETSAEMAEKLEPFIHFEFNKESFLEVMRRHQKSLDDVVWDHVKEEGLREATYNSWKRAIEKGNRFGFRNAQTTNIAPTGTIAYLMGADTTGIEPAISLKITKNLAGGGTLTLVNNEVSRALSNLRYSHKQTEDIIDFIDKNNGVIGAPHLNPDHYSIFDTAFGDGKGNGTIAFEGHVRILGAAQPFISGAISKTCNTPHESTVKDIYDSYLLGHELGLKALAVFRDNSKPTVALTHSNRDFRELKRGEKEELPSSGNSFRQEIRIGGIPFLINVGEYNDGRPGEVVIESYSAGSTIGDALRLAGISASKALKRGVDIEDVVAGWIGLKSEPSGLVTIDNPKGSHPFIKTALSPFDFLGKHLLIHYKGRTDLANDEKLVDVKNLRGATHGAFMAYDRMNVNEWDADSVLQDPEYGGFIEQDSKKIVLLSENRDNGSEKRLSNNRGITCNSCGSLMKQTAPNCYSCMNCGDKIGGCGQ